jgi:hypothetical protein
LGFAPPLSLFLPATPLLRVGILREASLAAPRAAQVRARAALVKALAAPQVAPIPQAILQDTTDSTDSTDTTDTTDTTDSTDPSDVVDNEEQEPNENTLTQAQYSKAFSAVISTVETSFAQASAAANSTKVAKYSFDNSDLTTQNVNTTIIGGCYAFLKFYNNLLNKTGYTISDDPEDCYVNDTHEGTYNIRMQPTYDSTNEIISAIFYVESPHEDVQSDVYGTDVCYFEIEINFDFSATTESEALKSFSFSAIMGLVNSENTLSDDSVSYHYYDNGSFKTLKDNANGFDTFATTLFSNMNSYKPSEWPADITDNDYSTQYMAALYGGTPEEESQVVE